MAWELMNSNPFKETEKERSEMDRLLDTFLFGKPKTSGFAKEEWRPPIDIAETEHELVVNVEIPGVDIGDLNLSLSGDILHIRGEKKPESQEEAYHHAERSYGSFSRSIHLHVEVQRDKISASYKNGVLSIILPKSERVKKKELKIKVE